MLYINSPLTGVSISLEYAFIKNKNEQFCCHYKYLATESTQTKSPLANFTQSIIIHERTNLFHIFIMVKNTNLSLREEIKKTKLNIFPQESIQQVSNMI